MSGPWMERVRSFLRAHKVAHVATAGAEGPHAAPVFFALYGDGLGLVWNSRSATLHSRHLAASPLAAVSVSPSSPSLQQIEGVQIRGRARAPEDLQEALAAAYNARYPRATSRGARPSAARAFLPQVADHQYYLFEPTWIRHVLVVAGEIQTDEMSFE